MDQLTELQEMVSPHKQNTLTSRTASNPCVGPLLPAPSDSVTLGIRSCPSRFGCECSRAHWENGVGTTHHRLPLLVDSWLGNPWNPSTEQSATSGITYLPNDQRQIDISHDILDAAE
jgi:hypothetical protein